MCGKFTQARRFQEMVAIADALLGTAADDETVTPMRFASVIALDRAGARKAVRMRWGLPSDAPAGKLHIHARAETVDSKPRFRDAFAKRRGLIVVSSFNEGEEITPARTQQYVLTPCDAKPIAIAVIWEPTDPLSFAMVTSGANTLIASITDRMPALIRDEDWSKWLGEEPATVGELKAMLSPSSRELDMRKAGKPPSPPRPRGNPDQAELF
jgi:putative SOS response-associated peptidase YedK